MEARLDTLRRKRLEGWKELASSLGITVTMLHYLRTGARHPSPKLQRRIAELETEAGLSPPVSGPMILREAGPVYGPTLPSKQVNIVELEHDLAQIESQIRALRKKIEEMSQ